MGGENFRPGAPEPPSGDAAFARLLLLGLGIVLTWLFYVLAARLLLGRLLPRAADDPTLG